MKPISVDGTRGRRISGGRAMRLRALIRMGGADQRLAGSNRRERNSGVVLLDAL
ncbi:MAG: hypothetical protein PHN98_09055 [Smithellaceae bacterium]|nr:hypothetical protein [Smithellaceae bacterium]